MNEWREQANAQTSLLRGVVSFDELKQTLAEKEHQRERADRAERILAALREPSEAVVGAFRTAYTRCESENHLDFTHIMGLSHSIRAAVAAAEQEVGA